MRFLKLCNNHCFLLFIISFLSMIVIMTPNMIQNHGLFMYAGDYFYQQIPFYSHASDVVNNFGIGWDWYTDLGNDFITSYSYYLVGSIFFWMISWLKSDLIIYAMPVMIAFKTAVASLGAFFYIKRYVKNDDAAFIGAYMYAFSGFQMASLVFNAFHDITALFPFLLVAFDMLVKEERKGFFAFMTGMIALTNYFFFFGIVIFVLIYYIIKCITKEFKFTLKCFLFIVFESCIGVGIAAIILLPTFLLLSSADRIENTLYGVDLVSYSDNTILPKIFQSIFIMPDPLSNGMLFKSGNNVNNWASISLYLPFFAATGVVSYVNFKKNDWISCLLKISALIAVIPAFNSLFSLFNASYYARWYYMPILLMSLATSKAIEEKISFLYGIKVELFGISTLALVSCLPDKVIKNSERMSAMISKLNDPQKKVEYNTELKWFSMSSIPEVLWQCIAFAVISVMLVYVYERKKDQGKKILKRIKFTVVILTVAIYCFYISNSISQLWFSPEEKFMHSVGYSFDVKDYNENAFRINNVSSLVDNYGLLWNVMSTGCFHSVEMNESDDFYYQIKGEKRGTKSYYSEEDYPANGLLSVKYILNASTGDDLNVELKPAELTGFSLYDNSGVYYIYKNDHFVPFGFMYDYCISADELENYLSENIEDDIKFQYKKLAMMRALVLDDKDIEKYKDYISVLPENMLAGLDENTYYSDCDARRKESCLKFDYDSKGYRAEINTDRKGLVYFSVPCSAGWSAKVNGIDTDIIKAHYGLTAIAVEPGENKIECSYKTPGLSEGKFISITSLAVLFGYILLNNYMKKSRERKNYEIRES